MENLLRTKIPVFTSLSTPVVIIYYSFFIYSLSLLEY